MKLEFYIVRNKRTGWYLPPGNGSRGRGTTHQNLVEPSVISPPKLFHTRGAAAASLRWWLAGETTVSRTGYSSFEDYEVDESWHTTPRPERKMEDMEIAKVELCL